MHKFIKKTTKYTCLSICKGGKLGVQSSKKTIKRFLKLASGWSKGFINQWEYVSQQEKKNTGKKKNTSLLKTCSFVHSTKPTVWLQLPGNSSAVPSRDPPRTTGPPSAWNPHLSRPRQTCSCSTSASSLPPTTCRTQRGGHTHSEDWTNFLTNSTNQERHYTQVQTLRFKSSYWKPHCGVIIK